MHGSRLQRCTYSPPPLGHQHYEVTWTMLHMLRSATGKREAQYTLSVQIELDEGFFSTGVKPEDKDKSLKQGRGSPKRAKVLVIAESQEVEGKTTKKGKPRNAGFIKMHVISVLKAGTINSQVSAIISNEATLVTDNSTSYTDLGHLVGQHQAQVVPKEMVGKVLP